MESYDEDDDDDVHDNNNGFADNNIVLPFGVQSTPGSGHKGVGWAYAVDAGCPV